MLRSFLIFETNSSSGMGPATNPTVSRFPQRLYMAAFQDEQGGVSSFDRWMCFRGTNGHNGRELLKLERGLIGKSALKCCGRELTVVPCRHRT